MRPVNLIPPDMRRGDSAPLRTGPLAYIFLGALVLLLVGVTMLVLVSNDVSEKKDELVTLKREDATAKARAEELAPYAEFQAMSQQRIETVTSLADSRFDWPRVMRELALVLPDDVLLSNLSAGAGASSGEGGEGLGGALGPSMELTGCTPGQEAVARFVTALKDIDGVTRVGLESSTIGEGSSGSNSQACEDAGYEDQYEIVVAFDAAPVPVGAEEEAVEAERKQPKAANPAKSRKGPKKAPEVKAQTKKRTNLLVIAMLVIVAVSAVFWMTLLSPKREEAKELTGKIESVEASLSQHQSEAAAAVAAKRSFPQDYARLVVIGKAVPSGDETPSLLVQLNHLATRAGASFEALSLEGGEEEAPVTAAPSNPTEAEVSLLPLGASVGPAGLAAMPYSLTFKGDFFQIASFVEGLDKLVKTSREELAVNGRLITVGSFSLTPVEGEEDGSRLEASLSVTAYVTPPGAGVTGGASPSGPEEVTSLTSSTIGTP